MSKVFRINVPAFGLSWSTHPEDSTSNILLLPGGGGSTRSGVKNQIIIASLSEDKIDFKQSHLTDTEKRSSLCCGISLGFVEDKPIAAALVDQFCIIYSVKDDAGGLKFTTLTEFEGDFKKEDPCLNVVIVTSTGLIVTGGDDGTLRIWAIKVHDSTATVVKLHELQKHTAAISAIHEHPSNPWIVSAGKDGRAIVWDYESGACLSEIPALIDGILDPKKINLSTTKIECRGCCFSPADPNALYTIQAAKMKATATYLIKWQIINIEKTNKPDTKEDEAQVIRVQYTPKKKVEVVKSPSIRLCVGDDGKYLAVGSSNCSVTVLNATTLKKIRSFMHHDLPVTGLSFAPAYLVVKEGLQTMLASCSADNKLVIMRIKKSSGLFVALLTLLLVLFAVLVLLYFSIDFMTLYHRMTT